MSYQTQRDTLRWLIYDSGLVDTPRPRRLHGLTLVICGWFLLVPLPAFFYCLYFPPKGLRIGSVWGFVLLFFGGLLLTVLLSWVGVKMTRVGWQHRLGGTPDGLLKDSRLPVLYLRAFQRDTESKITFILPPRTPERKLVRNLRGIGPVIALGRPGDMRQSFGAYRIFASSTDWPKVVQVLMNCCQVTLVMLDGSAWLAWELTRAAEICGPTKLLLGYTPHPRLALRRVRERQYQELREWASTTLKHPLPAEIGRARYIWFRPDWTPQLISNMIDWDNYVRDVVRNAVLTPPRFGG